MYECVGYGKTGCSLPGKAQEDLLSLPITHPTRRKMSGTARSGLFLTARRGLLTSDGVIGRDNHSNLKATIGFTRAARRAGMKLAANPVNRIIAEHTIAVRGSDGATTSSCAISCPAPTPNNHPVPSPTDIRMAASFSTSLKTRLGVAPRAIRIPISRVRRVTE